MALIPYGCVSQPLQTFRVMLSYCAVFQSWVEETDPDIPASGDARALFCQDYIHLGLYTKPSGGFVYPCAVVEVPEDVEYKTIAQGGASGGVFDTGMGMFDCAFIRTVPAALKNDDAGAWLEFAGGIYVGGVDDGVVTGIGGIMENLRDLPDSVDRFQVYDLSLVDGPFAVSESKQAANGNRMYGRIRVHWGIE